MSPFFKVKASRSGWKVESKLKVDQTKKRFRFPEPSTLEELDVGSVKKVPRVHGAVAPGQPPAADFQFLKTTFSPLRRRTLKANNEPPRISPHRLMAAGAIRN